MSKNETVNLDDKTHQGQAIYSNTVLKIYDLWVLGFSNTFLWKCKTKLLEEQFKTYTTTNHLDVGVGTGYYLKKCLTQQERRVALFDLNENSLNAAASKIKKFTPEKYQVNVLEPIEVECEKFDSISVNFLLHCLPNSIKEKAILFKHLSKYLNKDGVIFGSTILGMDVKKNAFANKLMKVYNKKGIFDNKADNIEDLKIELDRYFDEVQVELVGCVALFRAKKTR